MSGYCDVSCSLPRSRRSYTSPCLRGASSSMGPTPAAPARSMRSWLRTMACRSYAPTSTVQSGQDCSRMMFTWTGSMRRTRPLTGMRSSPLLCASCSARLGEPHQRMAFRGATLCSRHPCRRRTTRATRACAILNWSAPGGIPSSLSASPKATEAANRLCQVSRTTNCRAACA